MNWSSRQFVSPILSGCPLIWALCQTSILQIINEIPNIFLYSISQVNVNLFSGVHINIK